MDRRQALKNLGIGAGVILAGPTAISLLQSCNNKANREWNPVFLSSTNSYFLKEILDVIIPKTDIPGAVDLGVPQFIDSYMNQVASKEHQEDFTKSADASSKAFQEQFDKIPEDGSRKDYKKFVAKYLRSSSNVGQDQLLRRPTEAQDPMEDDPEESYSSSAQSYLENIREMGIWAWKNSREIGEEVLWYDPIPGTYIPCGKVQDLGNGRAMSL